MAEQQTAAISAAFPAPPTFYKAFTPSNLAQLKSLKETSTSPSGTQSPSQSQGITKSLLDLPPELRYLIPPARPLGGRYRSFGEERSVCLIPPSPIIPMSRPRLTVCYDRFILSHPHYLQKPQRSSNLLQRPNPLHTSRDPSCSTSWNMFTSSPPIHRVPNTGPNGTISGICFAMPIWL